MMKKTFVLMLTVMLLAYPMAFAEEISNLPTDYVTKYISVRTDDGVSLAGLLNMPLTGTPKVGIVFSSGQGSTFNAGMFVNYIGPHFAKLGYAALSLDRRDAGPNNACYGFNASAMDHKYGVDYLEALGCESVLIIGHSYGTITGPQYVRLSGDTRVKGFILYAPIGSLYESYFVYQGKEIIDSVIEEAREQVAAGNGAGHFLMPGFMPNAAVSMATYEAVIDKRAPETEGVGWEITAALQESGIPILCVRDPADGAPAVMGPENDVADKYIASNTNLEYVYLTDTRAEGDTSVSVAAHGMTGRMDEIFEITDNWIAEKGLGI